jgi:hypothetical protein
MRFLLLLFCLSAFAGDDSLTVWADAKAAILPSCVKFVKKFEGVGSEGRWRRKILERVKQRLTDRGAADEGAEVQAIALDWFADNEGRLRLKDRGAMLEACFWLMFFAEKGIPPPAAMRDRVTRENCRTMAAELDQAVEDEEGRKP